MLGSRFTDRSKGKFRMGFWKCLIHLAINTGLVLDRHLRTFVFSTGVSLQTTIYLFSQCQVAREN